MVYSDRDKYINVSQVCEKCKEHRGTVCYKTDGLLIDSRLCVHCEGVNPVPTDNCEYQKWVLKNYGLAFEDDFRDGKLVICQEPHNKGTISETVRIRAVFQMYRGMFIHAVGRFFGGMRVCIKIQNWWYRKI